MRTVMCFHIQTSCDNADQFNSTWYIVCSLVINLEVWKVGCKNIMWFKFTAYISNKVIIIVSFWTSISWVQTEVEKKKNKIERASIRKEKLQRLAEPRGLRSWLITGKAKLDIINIIIISCCIHRLIKQRWKNSLSEVVKIFGQSASWHDKKWWSWWRRKKRCTKMKTAVNNTRKECLSIHWGLWFHKGYKAVKMI